VKGIFITFEGPDGSGKTTQLNMLAQHLINNGLDVVTTREPGGTVISDKIRKILLDPNHKEIDARTEILLYAASRAQLVHELIIPALNEGKIVLCDRYIDASIAYQAYGLQFDRSIVESINDFASSELKANRTYLLTVSPETGRKRLLSRSNNEFNQGLDRIEQREIEYHQRVTDGFETLAKENKDRIVKIDANNTLEAVFKQIITDFELFLKSYNYMIK